MSVLKRLGITILTGALFTSCLAATGCGSSKKTLDGAKLVTFGDSLTALGSWPVSVAKSNNMYLFNAGNGGKTSEQALDLFDHYVANREPDFVTISFGMNDLIMEAPNVPRVTPDEYKENLRTICERVRELGATPILLTVSYLDEDKFWTAQAQKKSDYEKVGGSPLAWLDQYNAKVRELSAEGGYDMIDLRAQCDAYKPSQFLSDGIHLSQLGNQVYTDTINAYFEEHFARDKHAEKIENLVDYESSPAEPSEKQIISFEPSDWYIPEEGTMTIERDSSGALLISNTNNQWPDAHYLMSKAYLCPLEGSELVYDFSTGKNANTSIILFFGEATPNAYTDGQYLIINPALGVKTEAGSGDILKGQECKGSIPLADLGIPEPSVDANGNVMISGIKIYCAGSMNDPITFRKLAVQTSGAPKG